MLGAISLSDKLIRSLAPKHYRAGPRAERDAPGQGKGSPHVKKKQGTCFSEWGKTPNASLPHLADTGGFRGQDETSGVKVIIILLHLEMMLPPPAENSILLPKTDTSPDLLQYSPYFWSLLPFCCTLTMGLNRFTDFLQFLRSTPAPRTR